MHFSGLWQVPAVRALCVCLCACLSWALSLPCVWRRWDEALDDEMKKECSPCGWFCESQREADRVTSCLNLLGWAAEQPELTLPWIPVPWCTSEPLNPAGTWAAESHPYPELQPLLALPSPLCRRVLQACCSLIYHILSDVISREPWLHHLHSLGLAEHCTSPGRTNTAQKFRTVTNADTDQVAEVA